ncbi:MAG TPA: hypothetical protein VG456_10650 [Candidatus Sulfopaludibacter sp.]|jgi:hypothetical protein|nr:hypothetical protein [Candidatus Sulfopaludibacter sp.]
MSLKRSLLLIAAGMMLSACLGAAALPCVKPGSARWPIKVSLPDGAATKKMTLADVLALPRLTDVKKDDKRYAKVRITDQPVKEDSLVTITGWLYLVAFEADDCDFHIQISPEPRTLSNPPTKDDNCLIVEVPAGEYATTITDKVEGVRQWVIDGLLNKTPPKIGSVHVMQSPVYVTVTGALFYDDAHVYMADGGTGRGKKGMESKTLFELHPVTSIVFAPKPK